MPLQGKRKREQGSMCAAWRSPSAAETKSPCPMAQRLARIAARLFATRGYDATSVREIVEEAGVAKPTLYHYFGNKEGVAKALLTEPMTNFIKACEDLLGAKADGETAATVEGDEKTEIGEAEAQARTQANGSLSKKASVTANASAGLSPVDALARFLELHYEFCLEDPDRARFFYALLFGPSGAHLSQELIQYSHRLFELTMTGVSRVSRSHGMTADRAAEFARAVRGLIVITTMDSLYQTQDGENAILEEGLARRQIQSLLDGFAAAESRQVRNPSDYL